ncbi:Na+-transporting malonate decarboxylase, carboxybiotin decarboxylase subunit, madB [Schleiferilactobacillus harbinensis]|jgi:hypothetical protein|uniref:Na+-transporting malonate decarboxylase, carboxybiotin decarboxylase subunit, madB n=2 Tax=Schleiferilactobacillus harbinensis TaxID=304207 RepID=A0ABU7T3U2_9LACO|nr:hypothetical protein [Schleiferilactobacillus harbinensis]KRM25468.1 hypothetical protein FC91_GL000792 [Schleiferilactobacillus harbinensis DSM 16991]MBO3092102.1 Na+-transporting malonate decarboxylase, carboxybiotin decarboxylase subunit, madB [Schleiferilactobacillus harbinensis]MCT2909516.1 Na+-transporting malonate decarboxylase, carboxybiotin decarboxylase subunit, madB [Schleiferilactobacillus harbinensis]QEU46269.1 Na+-transporting malonate decarboxylase, carboxybiotin decarboxylase
MLNPLIIGHIIFGLASFAGALLLAAGFKDTFHTLTKLQQSGIILTVTGLFATLAFAMGANGNWLATIVFVLIGAAALGLLVWPGHQASRN